MPQIAKLYVNDEDGEPIGTFVVDMETLMDMYVRRMKAELKEPSPEELDSQSQVGLVRRATRHLGWYRDQPGGPIFLRPIPMDDIT